MRYVVFSLNGLTIKFSMFGRCFSSFGFLYSFSFVILIVYIILTLILFFVLYFIIIALSAVVLAVLTGSLDFRLYFVSKGWLNALLC